MVAAPARKGVEVAASTPLEPHPGSQSSTGWIVLWSAGLVAGAALSVLTLTDDSLAGRHVTPVLVVLVGWSFMLSGLVAWRQRPENRLGPLMGALGVLWI